MISQGLEYIEHTSALGNRRQQRGGLLIPLIFFQGLNSGVGHTHGVLLISSICAVSPAAAVVANAGLGYMKDWK